MEHSPRQSYVPAQEGQLPTAEDANALQKAPSGKKVLRPGDYVKAVVIAAAFAGGMGQAKPAEANQTEDILKAVGVAVLNANLQGSGFQIQLENTPKGVSASPETFQFMRTHGFTFMDAHTLRSPRGQIMVFGPATTSIKIMIAGPDSILVNVTSTVQGPQSTLFN
jgi:hypothetical protein